MNSLRQFWTLLKFQPLTNPLILFMPIVFSTPVIVPLFTRSISSEYHPGLSMVLSNPNLFFVAFYGIMWVAPESILAANAKWSSGVGFFLTRAIDRPLFYRARSLFFYGVILIMPFIFLIGALKNPALQIGETRNIQQQVLAHIPGSYVLPNKQQNSVVDIIIPNGNLLVNSYKLWIFTLSALATLLFLSTVCQLRFRKYIVWASYGVLILTPFLILTNARPGSGQLAFDERLFLYFASHQLLLWGAAIVALIVGQLWYERRFSRCEY